jgi:hypothetical protein
MDSDGSLQRRILSALKERPPNSTIQEWSAGPKRLRIELLAGGDIQVVFHELGKRGTPFETMFVIPSGEEEPASEDIADFVEKILDERIVLLMDGRFLRGGRRWVSPERISGFRKVDLVCSWAGTYDR